MENKEQQAIGQSRKPKNIQRKLNKYNRCRPDITIEFV